MSDEQLPDFTIHLAGPQIVFGTLIRQRCAWCGLLIEERDAALMAVKTDESASEEVQQHEANEVVYRTKWAGLVAISEPEGTVRWSVDDPEDGKAPPESCMQKEDQE